jgi:tetratricopeptide (TPR) repeat protein
MQFAGEHKLTTPASSHSLKRVVAMAAAAWMLLLLGFGMYYVLDQDSRVGPPGQTILAQKIGDAEAVVRADPRDVAARVLLADLYSAAGRHQEAAVQYEEALVLSEQNLPAVVGLAAAYGALGQPERALPLLEEAISRSEDSKLMRASMDMVQARLALGQLYLNQGRLEEAQMQANEAAFGAPANADVYLLAGQTLAAAGDHTGAVEQYRRALRFVPRFAEAYAAMATSYDAMGDLDRTAYARAMVTYSDGRFDAAARELEQVARAAPQLAEVRMGLGMAYERIRNFEDATVQYREALRLDPSLDYARTRLTSLERR